MKASQREISSLASTYNIKHIKRTAREVFLDELHDIERWHFIALLFDFACMFATCLFRYNIILWGGECLLDPLKLWLECEVVLFGYICYFQTCIIAFAHTHTHDVEKASLVRIRCTTLPGHSLQCGCWKHD